MLGVWLLAAPFAHADSTAPTDVTAATPTTTASAPSAAPRLTITASRYSSKTINTPGQVGRSERAELKRQGLDQTPDLLATQPGVLVQKTNHGGGSAFLHGLTGKQILLLVDGVRMNNSLYRFGPHQYLNTIDPYNIDAIEVVHGPTSVLYGSDALGGTINVLTRQPQRYSDSQPYGMGVGAGGASADRSVRGRLAYYGWQGSQGVRLGVTGKSFGDLTGGKHVGRQAHTGYDEIAADGKWRRELDNSKTVVAATQFHRQFDVPKTSELTLDGKSIYDYEPQVRSLSYVQLLGTLGGDAFVDAYTLSFSFQFHGEGELVQTAPGATPTRERNDAYTLGTFAHAYKTLADHYILSAGVEYYGDLINSEKFLLARGGDIGIKPAFPDEAYYHQAGLFLQGDLSPHERIRIVAGERLSVVAATGSLPDPSGANIDLDLQTYDFTGSFGVDARLVEQLHASAQVAQGFRAPNMEDFFGKVDFASEIPNSDLKPEKSLDLQTGLKYQSDYFSGYAFYFRDEYRDLIDRGNTVADIDGDGVTETVAQRQNMNRARIQGAALSLEALPLTWLSLRATYGYSVGDKLVRGRKVEPLRRIPPQMGSAAATFSWRHGLFLSPEFEWADRQDRLSGGDKSDKRIPAGGTPGYGVLHLRAGATLHDGGDLRLGLENVFDKTYKTHGSGIYSPGRNFYLEYAYRL